jgi:hypothetical protein
MKSFNKIFSILVILASAISTTSCGGFSSKGTGLQKLSFSEIVFEAHLPASLNSGEGVLMEVLDEVTGIVLNPERFYMRSKDGQTFSVRVPLAIGSLIRYRYLKSGQNNIIEKDALGNQVQYRLYSVSDPSVVKDFVVNWENNSFTGTTGELSGYIYDQKTEAPLGEILVEINGVRTFTSFDGFYKFENVPLGEYHLTAIHPDGKYKVFQQNAIIAENSITPASFGMIPAKIVNVTFEVTAPENTNKNAVIKILGNTYSLGNTFTELTGGISTLPSRAPSLNKKSDGKYELTLYIPEGTDLRYKYSLGNGLINAEHDANHNIVTRQLIIPAKDITVSDEIASWFSKGSNPVNFIVTAPQNTPINDFVSIQFNPFVWFDPIPMWKVGENQWAYTLYSPFEYLNGSQYRFCRNNQCGIADDEVTKGINATGYQLSLTDNQPLTINYRINEWFGLQPFQYSLQPVSFPSPNSFFIKAFQFQKQYNFNWLSAMKPGFIDMGVSGANWLFFSPTWSFSKSNNFPAGLRAGQDSFAEDITRIKEQASEAGMTLAIYPQMNPDQAIDNYWSSSGLSYNWWQNWFDQYEKFIINYADFSESHGINTLIIGGKSVSPSFPNGVLPNGVFSNSPYDFGDRWTKLIEKIRSRFSGQIGFALPYSSDLGKAPSNISSSDFIYLEMDSSIKELNGQSLDDLTNRFGSILDKDVYNLYATYQKPVILGLDFYSLSNTQIDVNEQANIYQAILRTCISRPWIYGLVSAGFNPSASVQDSSASIYGKPAMGVLSYYFNNLKQ